jgi:tetratricopeptide (TPR) repeat protein
MLKRWLFVTFIASILMTFSHTDAQQDADVLYIELTSVPENEGVYQEFLDPLKEALETEGINPIYIDNDDTTTYPYFWENDAIHLIFYRQFEAELIRVTPYVTMELPLSPILEATYDISPGLELEDEESIAAAIKFILGIAWYAKHDCDQAVPYLEEALQSKTLIPRDSYTNPSINFYLANCALLASDGDLEAVLPRFEEILPRSEYGLRYSMGVGTNIAWLYLQLGREHEAFELMGQIIDASEKYDIFVVHRLRLFTKRSQLYALDFRFAEAIADMDAAIQIATDEHPYPATLAELYTERGQRVLLTYEWDAVLADYNRAIDIDPTYAPAYFHRGILFYTQGPRASAVPDFQRYLELAPAGEYAEQAAQYIADIQVELDALATTTPASAS